MPTVCTSALLAGEFGFENTSCWDIKSGCSTGVLALVQALDWFQNGAKKGVIVCAETFSKFTNKDILQMAVSIGDGASAMIVKADPQIKVHGVVHGTNPAYLKTMYVPGKYPVDEKNFNPIDYTFHFEDKTDALEKMAYYWTQSLKDLLQTSGVQGKDIHHYFSHQVDGTKNKLIATSCGIKEEVVAMNFEDMGNMGCPTIFINYHQWKKRGHHWNSKEKVIFHAVGGGLSWAGICLEKE
jgi:3-oxoacyl-[acyl-carrier-protein] synthase III